MIDDTKSGNPFDSWPLHIARAARADTISSDDPRLGTIGPNQPAWTTPKLAWVDFSANPAFRVADSITMIQSAGRPKVVLVYDLDVAHRLRLRPSYRGRGQRKGASKTS